jgi:hypothetical protein
VEYCTYIGELESRGVNDDVRDVCAAMLADLARADGDAEDTSAANPDEVFRRLAAN